MQDVEYRVKELKREKQLREERIRQIQVIQRKRGLLEQREELIAKLHLEEEKVETDRLIREQQQRDEQTKVILEEKESLARELERERREFEEEKEALEAKRQRLERNHEKKEEDWLRKVSEKDEQLSAAKEEIRRHLKRIESLKKELEDKPEEDEEYESVSKTEDGENDESDKDDSSDTDGEDSSDSSATDEDEAQPEAKSGSQILFNQMGAGAKRLHSSSGEEAKETENEDLSVPLKDEQERSNLAMFKRRASDITRRPGRKEEEDEEAESQRTSVSAVERGARVQPQDDSKAQKLMARLSERFLPTATTEKKKESREESLPKEKGSPKPGELQRGASVYQALRDEMMKQRSGQPPAEKQVKPAPPPAINVQPATMMDVIMMGSVINRPPPSREKDLLGIRTAQQQRVGMSMIRRDDQKGRLEARRKLRDELALKEKQVEEAMHAKLKKDQDLQNLLKESELLKPAISKGTTIGGKPITILEPTAEIDMNILVPKSHIVRKKDNDLSEEDEEVLLKESRALDKKKRQIDADEQFSKLVTNLMKMEKAFRDSEEEKNRLREEIERLRAMSDGKGTDQVAAPPPAPLFALPPLPPAGPPPPAPAAPLERAPSSPELPWEAQQARQGVLDAIKNSGPILLRKVTQEDEQERRKTTPVASSGDIMESLMDTLSAAMTVRKIAISGEDDDDEDESGWADDAYDEQHSDRVLSRYAKKRQKMLRKRSGLTLLKCAKASPFGLSQLRWLASARSSDFEGLYAATLTAWNRQGEPELEKIEPYARKLIKDNVQGVFVCGTSGESMSLSVAERKQILEKWVNHAHSSAGTPGLRVIAHIGTASLQDSCELAGHAASLGVAGISVMPPFFFKPRDVTALVEHLGKIASAAPKTPFLYYHFPEMTGVNIPVYDVLVEGSKVIPTLSGAKFTSLDLGDYYRCVALEGGRYSILQGYEQMMLPCLSLGARGFIGLSYSYCAPIYHRLIEAVRKGDMATARSLQLKVTNLVTPCAKVGYIPTAKLLMNKLAGLEFGGSRLPVRSLSTEEAAAFLSEQGVQEFLRLLQEQQHSAK